jgi:opacity protein-like surface antigen
MNTFFSCRFWIGVLSLSVISCMACPAAQAEAGPFSIGGRAVDFVPRGGSDAWMGGIQARLRLPLFFGVEGSVDYRRETFGSDTTHEWPVMVSGLIYLPKIILVQPFILGGAGWYNTRVEGPAGFNDTQNRFGPHVGAGVEVNLDTRWFLDATYRYVWLNDLRSVDALGVPQHIRDSGHMITAGLNFRL